MSDEQAPIKCGAHRVISAEGLSVVVIMGDRELLMSPDNARLFGQRIVEEAQLAQGIILAVAGMADGGLSEQTRYRAMHYGAYGKRVHIRRGVR